VAQVAQDAALNIWSIEAPLRFGVAVVGETAFGLALEAGAEGVGIHDMHEVTNLARAMEGTSPLVIRDFWSRGIDYITKNFDYRDGKFVESGARWARQGPVR
jgi:hypothetical protein